MYNNAHITWIYVDVYDRTCIISLDKCPGLNHHLSVACIFKEALPFRNPQY